MRASSKTLTVYNTIRGKIKFIRVLVEIIETQNRLCQVFRLGNVINGITSLCGEICHRRFCSKCDCEQSEP